MRAVADQHRLLIESLACVVRVEDELDHLPVALVRVVEVVECVEEPVLESELSGSPRFRGDVRVDGRLGALGKATRPELVVAAGVERVAREVEVILEAVPEIFLPRPDLHEIGPAPRPAERHRGLVIEEQPNVERVVRLPRPAALLLLLDETNDGRKALREGLLVVEIRARERRHEQRSREQRRKRNPSRTAGNRSPHCFFLRRERVESGYRLVMTADLMRQPARVASTRASH